MQTYNPEKITESDRKYIDQVVANFESWCKENGICLPQDQKEVMKLFGNTFGPDKLADSTSLYKHIIKEESNNLMEICKEYGLPVQDDDGVLPLGYVVFSTNGIGSIKSVRVKPAVVNIYDGKIPQSLPAYMPEITRDLAPQGPFPLSERHLIRTKLSEVREIGKDEDLRKSLTRTLLDQIREGKIDIDQSAVKNSLENASHSDIVQLSKVLATQGLDNVNVALDDKKNLIFKSKL